MWLLVFAALSTVVAELSGCTSDVVRYMEKMQVSFMSAAAEAADYLPISRCDCILNDDTKETPLHRVVNLASHGRVSPGPLTVVVEALLAKHGDLSATDHTGATPLHLAAFHGEVAAMSVLAWAAARSSSGALIFGIKDAEGLTPLARALKAWKVPAARILALSGAPAANATLLVECRPDLVEAVLQTEISALIQAVTRSPAPDAAGNCLVPPNSGRNSTLLHLAAELSIEDGGPEVVQMLLDTGAKVGRPDSNGDTALNSALRQDSSEVVSMMLSEGSSTLLSQTNRQGQSALHVAAAAGASNSVRLLVIEGADATAKDAKGKTPLQYAEQRGDDQAIESISMAATLRAAAEDNEGKADGFKSSSSWSAEDEAAAAQADAIEGGLSTELIAAVIVAVAGGGLCLVLFVCMLRRRLGRRKRSMVAQEAKPKAEKAKQVWTEQTEALPKNRTFEDRRDSNEVHELPGSALKPSSFIVQTDPRSSKSEGFRGEASPPFQAPKGRSSATKGHGQGPRQAAKADSPVPVPDRPQRKAKAKSRTARQPK